MDTTGSPLPQPPNHPQRYCEKGAAGIGLLWRGTWPFGRFEATLDYIEISVFPALRQRLDRAGLDAVEYLRGVLGARVWLEPRHGSNSFWYTPSDLQLLLWNVTMLGWRVRERPDRRWWQ